MLGGRLTGPFTCCAGAGLSPSSRLSWPTPCRLLFPFSAAVCSFVMRSVTGDMRSVTHGKRARPSALPRPFSLDDYLGSIRPGAPFRHDLLHFVRAFPRIVVA